MPPAHCAYLTGISALFTVMHFVDMAVTILVPILQMMKRRQREVKKLAKVTRVISRRVRP